MLDDTTKAERLATSLASKNYNSFWSCNRVSYTSDNCLTSRLQLVLLLALRTYVIIMWYDHYRSLFNSVQAISRDINADFIHTHCDFVKDDNHIKTST
jgi:hypothetical protein